MYTYREAKCIQNEWFRCQWWLARGSSTTYVVVEIVWMVEWCSLSMFNIIWPHITIHSSSSFLPRGRPLSICDPMNADIIPDIIPMTSLPSKLASGPDIIIFSIIFFMGSVSLSSIASQTSSEFGTFPSQVNSRGGGSWDKGLILPPPQFGQPKPDRPWK